MAFIIKHNSVHLYNWVAKIIPLEAIINEKLDVPALICAKPTPANKTESGWDIFYVCPHFYVYPYILIPFIIQFVISELLLFGICRLCGIVAARYLGDISVGVIGVAIDIFADMFPTNLRGAGIAATIRHPVNILMVYRCGCVDNCSVAAKDGIIRICRSLARGISILRCKIVLTAIEFFGNVHSAYFLKKA